MGADKEAPCLIILEEDGACRGKKREELEKLTGVPMPEQVRRLRELPIRHRRECEKNAMGEAVLAELA